MKYFENFPRTIYTFDKNAVNNQVVTDILSRSAFVREIANNTSIAYDYQVQDSDTPEVIAHKVYGDPYRSWIILLLNQIINPYYDWPMKLDVLESYITKKYNSTTGVARTQIHHYEQEIVKVSRVNGLVLNQTIDTHIISDYYFNEVTSTLVRNALPQTADTSIEVESQTFSYDTYDLVVTTSNKAVSNYTYEFEENEKRRRIKLLDEKYISRVEEQFKEIMKNG